MERRWLVERRWLIERRFRALRFASCVRCLVRPSGWPRLLSFGWTENARQLSRNHKGAPNENSNVPPDLGAHPCQPVNVERKRHLIRIIAPAVGLLAAGLLVWQGSY